MLYAGAALGNRATWDRFAPAFEIDYSVQIEKAIISRWLHPNVIRLLYQEGTSTAKDGIVLTIREAIKKRDILDHLSFRSIERFAKHYSQFGWHMGMEIFIINCFNPAYRETIRNKITINFGNEFCPSMNDHDSTPTGKNYIPKMKDQIRAKGSAFEGVV
jgi:hypothetical protein